jgi:hypothetical protein
MIYDVEESVLEFELAAVKDDVSSRILPSRDGSVYGCCWDIPHVSFTLLGWVKDRVYVALWYFLHVLSW